VKASLKVFWSWQSDTPGGIGRFFVRDALEAAISQLKDVPDITEPTTAASRDALHLDQDRRGVPGSPDLAKTILDKIDDTSVFVADVTPVCRMQGRVANGRRQPSKRLMNPNVAIELGYALKALTDRYLLMVLNEHYGSREHLPFDLRHKAGPIAYRLAPDADKATIAGEQKRLIGVLAEALRPYLSQPAISVMPFKEAPPAGPETPAVFFNAHEALATIGDVDDGDAVDLAFDSTDGFYLRLIPTKTLAQPISLATLKQEVSRTAPFGERSSGLSARSDRGAISFDMRPEGQGLAMTQLFQNGEIWGFNITLLRDLDGAIVIPSLALEQGYYDSARAYFELARSLGNNPPFVIEMGATGLKNVRIGMPDRYWPDQRWGPILHNELRHRNTITNINDLDSELQKFFSSLFDLAGHPRPDRFYGFPPDRPHQ
jgi:hypothetical protein